MERCLACEADRSGIKGCERLRLVFRGALPSRGRYLVGRGS